MPGVTDHGGAERTTGPDHGIAVETPDGAVLSVGVRGHGPVVVLLHPGGPGRHSLDPLAERLHHDHTVVRPDIRGYGRFRCADPARHTWRRRRRARPCP